MFVNKEVLDALSDVSHNYVEDAAPRKRSGLWRAVPAAAAALVLLVGALLVLPKFIGRPWDGNMAANDGADTASEPPVSEAAETDIPAVLPTDTPAPTPTPKPFPAVNLREAAAAYPEEREYPQYPSLEALTEDNAEEWSAAMDLWQQAAIVREKLAKEAPDISGFARALFTAIMDGSEGSNLVCSPANIYVALSMLAECTNGETREQILSALGVSDTGSLRSGVSALLDTESNDDGAMRCLFENSLWLNNGFGYNTETMERLAEVYRAAGFWGDPADPEFAGLLGKWLDEKTGGTLGDIASHISLDPNMMLTLASTLRFSGKWFEEYPVSETKPGVFHSPSGDVEREFMHKNSRFMLYYRGRDFTAAAEICDSDGDYIWYLMPDEGVAIEEIMAGEGMEFLLSDKSETCRKVYDVYITIPKLHITSDLDIADAMKKLGVTDCFESSRSDYSGLAQGSGLALTEARHCVSITSDEKGIDASSLVLIGAGAAIPEKVYVNFDRPFAFAIMGKSNAPLFMGVVNDPIG